MYCSAQFGYLDQLQDDLRASRPELDIQILGMNPFQEESGNAAVTEGRDIPWLQDVDADGDNFGDTWLVDWPFVYRDVVIVDANGVAVDSYNLTINSLEEPESYSTLRQMLIDVAVSAIDGADDSVAVLSGATSEINVLANDVGSSRLSITDITMPEFGVAEIATIEYPATLDPVDRPITDLVISEIVPGEYIEIYNSSFTESVDLGAVSHVLVSGEFDVDIAALSSDDVPARGVPADAVAGGTSDVRTERRTDSVSQPRVRVRRGFEHAGFCGVGRSFHPQSNRTGAGDEALGRAA